MKNVLWLICILSLSYSCKQTQLTSNYSKRSNKIYTKAPLNFKGFDVASNKKIASAPKKSRLIRKSVEKQFYAIEKINKDELFTDLKVKEIKEASVDNRLRQEALRVDSILKSNYKNISDTDDIEKISKRAKKISLISLVNAILSGVSYLIAFPTIYDFFHVLGAIFGISSFVLSVIALVYLIKSLKKIKNKGEKINEQNNSIKKDMKTSFWLLMLLLLAPIVGGIIFLLTFSISIGSMGPFYF